MADPLNSISNPFKDNEVMTQAKFQILVDMINAINDNVNELIGEDTALIKASNTIYFKPLLNNDTLYTGVLLNVRDISSFNAQLVTQAGRDWKYKYQFFDKTYMDLLKNCSHDSDNPTTYHGGYENIVGKQFYDSGWKFSYPQSAGIDQDTTTIASTSMGIMIVFAKNDASMTDLITLDSILAGSTLEAVNLTRCE